MYLTNLKTNMKNQIIKSSIYFLLVLIFGCSQKPEGFIIQGNVAGFKDSTMLYLHNPDLQENIDSAIVVNGKFQFDGFLSEPQRLYVNTVFTNMDEYRYTSFFVENSLIKLKGNYDNFRYCDISGSKSQDIEKKLIKKIKSNDIERDSLTDYFFKNRIDIIPEEHKKIWQQISLLDSLNDIQYIRFIKGNLNSYSAMEKLQWRMSEMPKDTLRMYYEQLIPEFKESANGKLMNVYLNSRIVEIGEKYIDFEAVTLNSEPFKLSDIKKDYILLDFWAAGCGPCRKANTELAKYYDELKDRMEIVSFSLDIKKEWIEKASEKDGIKWINVTDYKGRNSAIAIQYQISGIPCSYLINKERVVIKKYLGFDPEYIDEIKEIVQ